MSFPIVCHFIVKIPIVFPWFSHSEGTGETWFANPNFLIPIPAEWIPYRPTRGKPRHLACSSILVIHQHVPSDNEECGFNMILQTIRIHWYSQVQQWDIVGIIIIIRPLKSNWINKSQTKLEQVCSNVHLFWMIFVATPKPNQSKESKVCLWFTVRSLYKKSDLAARQDHLFVDARADRCKALAMPLEKKQCNYW